MPSKRRSVARTVPPKRASAAMCAAKMTRYAYADPRMREKRPVFCSDWKRASMWRPHCFGDGGVALRKSSKLTPVVGGGAAAGGRLADNPMKTPPKITHVQSVSEMHATARLQATEAPDFAAL